MKLSAIFYITLLTGLFFLQTPVHSQEDIFRIFPGYIKSNNDSGILNLEAGDENDEIIITNDEVLNSLKDYQYFIMEISHNNPYSGIIQFEFFREENGKSEPHPRISSKIGILPGIQAYVVFPLSYLNGQNIFIDRYPWQLKGVVFGKRLHPEQVSKMKIIPKPFRKPGFLPDYKISKMYLSNELPGWDTLKVRPLVDKYGQWKNKEWKDKINNEEEWEDHKNSLLAERKDKSNFPAGWSRYGGREDIRFDSTGFFNIHNDGTRWWFVDPEGYAFLSYGMDCVHPSVRSLVENSTDLYEWLPEKESEFSEAFIKIRELGMIDFFVINMIRIFGEDWYDQWQILTANRLMKAGFNTVGNWSDIKFAQSSKMPYVLPLSGFPSTEVNLYRDFPDVFSPQYRFNAKEYAAQLKDYKDDKYLIGYFLRNEPQWAFGKNDLAFEMFAADDMSFTKMKFTDWLKERYNHNIDSLNRSWQIELKSFTSLRDSTFDDYPSEKSKEDFRLFTEKMVDAYISIVCDEVEKVDPNHLNLGMRYGGISSDLLYRAGERFDVFSLNSYSDLPSEQTLEIYKRTGKPVLIGEFHFGAVDRGLPSTGLRGVATQKDRAKAYRNYVENGFERPEVIGIHYFQWMDQAVLGRFDGENYNIGFNNILYGEYPELFKAALKAHNKAYRLATGKGRAYSRKPERIPSISF